MAPFIFRFSHLRFQIAAIIFFFVPVQIIAQSFSFNCSRDTTIAGCSPIACFTLKGIIPDLHGLSTTYSINPSSTVLGCAPVYAAPDDPAGTPTNLFVDDTYSGVINLTFNFPFFGTAYNNVIVSANGVVSFDVSKAGGSAHYTIPSDLPSNSYDRAIIMGPYHDLDPSEVPDPRIQYQEFGLAPHRRWIFSFFRIPLYSTSGACSSLRENTHQIILYESTGIIEVTVFSKQICSSWQSGKAMIGMQDFNRTESIMAPGRRASDPPWGSVGMNESWRFVPASGPSLFKRVELYDLAGNMFGTGITLPAGNGTLEASFTNVCPPANATTSYIIKSVYQKIDDPAVEIFGTDTIRITKGPPVDLNATATTLPSGCGSPSGTINVSVPTGTAPFTYILDGGTPQTTPSPAYSFTNVAAGAHTILVTDASGVCNSTVLVTVSLTNNLTAVITPTATSCPTASDGSVVINPSNGNAPFTFTLNPGGITQSGLTASFTGLAVGNYTVSITDAIACSTTPPLNFTIAAGPSLSATVNSTGTSCSGASNGTISVTPTSGTGPFTFVLNPGNVIQTGASNTIFIGQPAGAYSIVVSDAAGCSTASLPVTITAGPSLTTTATQTSVLCNGGATGQINVAVPTSGSAPYEYSLDNILWQSSNVFSGLSAGGYTVFFREANGCNGQLNIAVTEPPVLDVIPSTVPVICNGESNGLITVAVTGGILPYEYSLNGIIWQSSNFFNVPAGNYTVSIRDVNLCVVTRNIVITEPQELTANSSTGNATCDGGNDGVITITASGGNSAYSYSLDGINFQPGNIFNVAPGNYNITVKDNLGCIVQVPATVGLTNNLNFTQPANVTICESKSAQLNFVSNAAQFSWTPATGLSNTSIANPIAAPVTTTTYTITATLGRCSAESSITVNVNAAPIPDAGVNAFICYGQSYQLQGTGGMQYIWSPSTYLDNPNVPDPVSIPLKTITYTLTGVIDANGCEALTTDEMTVDVTPPVKVTTFPSDTIAHPGDTFTLNAIAATASANIFSWSPGTRLSNPDISNPVVTVGEIGNDILYQVTASSAAGCKGEGYVRIRVYKGPELYVPTGFTPNGDGRNDKFYPFPVGIKSINYFRVFNRWGQTIFSSSRLWEGWDGKKGGEDQPSGTYVWMAEGITIDGKVITKKGVVTLIR